MIHLGDITRINGAEIEPVDCITGGSPCQDLSVAGKRAGLAGERSGLFMEQIRVIKEMRQHEKECGRADEFIRPRWMVWENVPGAFSSNDGEDFRAVLEETARIVDETAVIPRPPKGKWASAGCIMGNGWSIAWRVHDAQFWGVPQRRKRIALVADFGGTTAPEILFERKGMSGDITESGEEEQSAAEDAGRGVTQAGKAISFQERAGKPGGGKGILIQNERTGALSTLNNQSVCAEAKGFPLGFRAENTKVYDEKSTTICNGTRPGFTCGVIQAKGQAVVYGISAYDSNSMKSPNPNSGIYEAETARTLDLNGGSPACNQGGMAVVQAAGVDTYNQTMDDEIAQPLRAADGGDSTPKVVCLEGNGSRPSHQGDGWHEGDPMYTLNSTEHHAVVVENHPNDSRVKISEDGIVQTLSGRMGTGGGNTPMVMESMAFSDVAACRSAQDGRGAVHSQMMSDPEGNFVLGPVTASKASFFTNANSTGTAETLVATDYKDPQIVAYGMDRAAYNQGANAKFDFSVDEEKVGTCVAKGPGAVCARDYKGGTSVVRRLTPLECERLQGFPDGWTDIGDWTDSKGKVHKGDSDSPRYKALGNSIALPFWFYLLRRISATYERPATLGSLFDGIGGFPLCWETCNVKGTARWASEIEEFPIAVTKKHFKEDT